jgi:hypothetical protein
MKHMRYPPFFLRPRSNCAWGRLPDGAKNDGYQQRKKKYDTIGKSDM